jgi:cytochrome c553
MKTWKLLALSSLSMIAISFTACGDETVEEESDVNTRTEIPLPVEEDENRVVAKTETSATAESSSATKETKSVETVEEESAKEEVIDSTPVNGGELFASKCASCHGANADQSALGKSQKIAGWETSKVVDALNGYKNGTYGGSMKGLMKGQAMPLKGNEIQALAEYISTK